WLVPFPINASIIYSSVKNAPTSTTNITGLFHCLSGRSIRNACFSAAIAVSFSISRWGFLRRWGLCRLACMSGGKPASERHRTKVVCYRPQRGNGQKEQCPDNKNRPQQQDAECWSIIPQRPQAKWTGFLLPEICSHGNRSDDRNKPAE